MPHRLIPTGKRCCGYGNETEYGYFFLPGYTGDYPQVSRRREVGLLDEGALMGNHQRYKVAELAVLLIEYEVSLNF